eukprot:TRINITY_DN10570_c0_g3_i1.p1 TRINITY_DN10570_c0_g3~~TRINITY_DN10570_c0_g3_i1.p1  ORF type:complete len:911 (-),score=195.04 TRINITY_DN10570_c0_g3_i1:144-2657(-)
MTQYRHTELLQSLLLLAQRLCSGLAGLSRGSNSVSGDPEFQSLWKLCLVWVCRVFRIWTETFPAVAGGQLLQPLIRHSRVLPTNFTSGLLLLATCGSFRPLMPQSASYSFSLQAANAQLPTNPGETSVKSQSIVLPASTRAGLPQLVVLKATPTAATEQGEKRLMGQFWDCDCEAQDFEAPEAASAAACGVNSTDPLVREFARERQSSVAQAFGLVELVNSRRERLTLEDLTELCSLVAECALTSDALLHLCTVRVMEKLAKEKVPVLNLVLGLAQRALNGVPMTTVDDPQSTELVGGAARDARDARAVSRLLMLLAHFGASSPAACQALLEEKADSFSLSVLAHTPPSSLQTTAATQAIRLLGIMFSVKGSGNKAAMPSAPSSRMVSKAVDQHILNKAAENGRPGAPAISAALELLLGLCKHEWICLNLLFNTNGVPRAGNPVEIVMGGAFKLTQCAQRLAREIATALKSWQVQQGSEDQTLALEEVSTWLKVSGLLVNLCKVVVTHCPTASVFMKVVMPGSSSNLLAELFAALSAVAHVRKQSVILGLFEEVPGILRMLTSLREELQSKDSGEAPKFLPGDRLLPPRPDETMSNGKSEVYHSDSGEDADDEISEQDVGLLAFEEAVGLLDAAANLEASPEWSAVAELDKTEFEDSNFDWEFDANAFRKKRHVTLEKIENDRKAKRLKKEAERTALVPVAAARRREAPPTAPSAETPAAPPPAAPSPAAEVPKAEVPKPTSETVARTKEEPVAEKAAAPEKTAAAPEKTAAPAPAAGKANPAVALQSFMKDHPEFMRILQNPKKLQDPRVKSMFMSELENYPEVRKFLESKGMKFT